jgi:3-oxoacyl-[acyl-carrier-protein] synthase-3
MKNESRFATIIGTGFKVPEQTLSNEDLSRMVETDNEWIVSRTGIRNRYIASKDDTPWSLGAYAAKMALEAAKVRPNDLDAIIVATCTNDAPFPSAACRIQASIGASTAYCYDVSAACSGFIYGLHVANMEIATGRKNVLLVGADTMTRNIDYTDRSTCIIFGDGASAAVLQESPQPGIIDISLGSDGTQAELLKHVQDPRTRAFEGKTYAPLPSIKMEGRPVLRFATRVMVDSCLEYIDRYKLDKNHLCIVPHQANQRIIDAAADKLQMQPYSNIDRFGNTSAASCGIALHECVQKGVIKNGDHAFLVAMGAGLTWGYALMRWNGTPE